MADRRRLVSIAWDGTVTVIRDLEDSVKFFTVQDSFNVIPAARKTVMATIPRRYGGALPAAETHDNAAIEWKMLVRGVNANDVLVNVEALLGGWEITNGLFIEWRPDGATNSSYYEIRGPATWKPTYSWMMFMGSQSMIVDITIPVAPLAWGDKQTIAIPSTGLPAVVQLSTAILGDAPALVDLSLTSPGGFAGAPIWGLIGWTKRPGAPLAGSVAPFGVIEAETGGTLAGWAVTADATYRGGSGLKVTAAGAGTASALFTIDPSVLQPDDFTPEEVDVEVWARVALDSTLVLPQLTMSLLPLAGATFGGTQYTGEFGAAGKFLTVPSTGTGKFRRVRLGTLSLPYDAARPLKWNLKIAAAWSTGSTGTFGLDQLELVPARQRACNVSNKANDAGYGQFIGTTAAATKTIRADLSGRIASGAGNPGRSAGMGGSPLEFPPGNVDVLLSVSNLVPDDPTSDATTEQLAWAGITGSLLITPRYWLARSS